jgi:acetolactate synthase small subunit
VAIIDFRGTMEKVIARKEFPMSRARKVLEIETVEITGAESMVERFIGLMNSFGVTEITRTDKVALPRK